MKSDPDKSSVVHNESSSRFEIRSGRHLAVLEYKIKGNVILLYHTGVPPELEGRNIAHLLARAALDFAREHSYGVVPLCVFVQAFLQRHPEYQDLVVTR